MINFLNDIYYFASDKKNFGLLIFRIVLGLMFMWHGFPKLSGGPEKWAELGQVMSVYGITFVPALWGFLSAFAECIGGLLVFLGLFYRLAAILLFGNLLVAFSSQMLQDKGLFKSSQSLEDGFNFFAAFFIGPGRYSIDYYLNIDRQIK
ncbi:DoxX family protein [Pectinatus haikarae]|uniref:Oxidoreductase n=1 Tax=Pectinatus haikarae TaxID=349096 RepID=A0ABT9YAX7_9FIRM|nr:DoxX family protein [Pectinatus haikarae]MDQ0204879.1 putative oxidoreductase [Pectinatus haikarae]